MNYARLGGVCGYGYAGRGRDESRPYGKTKTADVGAQFIAPAQIARIR